MHKVKAATAIVVVGVAAYLSWRYILQKKTLDPNQGGIGYQFPNGFNDLPNWENGDDGSDSVENRTTKLMIAIAKAEGFNVPGSIPQQANNPGDLTLSLGFATAGGKLGTAGIVKFASIDDGWGALQKQLDDITTGNSRYPVNISIADFSVGYTTTEAGIWARNVASSLNTDVNATLDQFLT